MPAQSPPDVDVWMHKLAYICFPAPGTCVHCCTGHGLDIGRNVSDDFQMLEVGTDFKCELK